jgi:hypothetical protein
MRGAGSGQIIKSAPAFKIVYMKMKLEEMDRPFMSAAREGDIHGQLFCTAQYCTKSAYGLVYVNLLSDCLVLRVN